MNLVPNFEIGKKYYNTPNCINPVD